MPAWIASIIAAALPKLLEWLWGKASDALKDRLAEDRIRAHVQKALQEYEQLVLKHDDLQDKGTLTPEKSQEIKNDKIKLEEDILNGVLRARP